MLENYKSYEITEANMKIIRQKFADKPGVVLVRSNKLLAKIIRFFMSIQQFKAEGKTSLLPNHIDIVKDNYAIGALANGVEGDELWAHFKHHKGGQMWLVDIYLPVSDLDMFWKRALIQQKKGYAYLDLLWMAIYILTGIWLGKKSNNEYQKRYTCYNLFAVLFNMGINYGWENIPYFKHSRRATPYTVVNQMLQTKIFKFEKK